MPRVCGLMTDRSPMPRRSNLRITKRTVDALSVEAGDATFWDRSLPGFGLRVHATGRKVYIVQSRGPRGLKRVSLGRHGDLTPDEARKEAAAVIDRIKRGDDPIPAPPEPELTVAGLAERYLEAHVAKHCKAHTAALYRTALEKHILPALGGKTLGEVGRGDVADLHDGMRDTPHMANIAAGVLSNMYRLAGTWELVPAGRNPCRSLRRYRKSRRERFLTEEEFRRLGRALREAEAKRPLWPQAVAAIRLLLLSGCRKTEILTLRWDDVDRVTGELRLRETKSGPRMVPLSPPLARVLDGIPRPADNPWVIAGRKPGTHLSDLTYYWRCIADEARLKDIRIHDCRHSYASRALALGHSLSMIGRLLGHSEVATTARYAHLVRDAEKAAASRVGDSIGAHVVPDIAGVSGDHEPDRPRARRAA